MVFQYLFLLSLVLFTYLSIGLLDSMAIGIIGVADGPSTIFVGSKTPRLYDYISWIFAVLVIFFLYKTFYKKRTSLLSKAIFFLFLLVLGVFITNSLDMLFFYQAFLR